MRCVLIKTPADHAHMIASLISRVELNFVFRKLIAHNEFSSPCVWVSERLSNAFVADRSKKLISSRSGKDLGVHMRVRARRQEKTCFWHRNEISQTRGQLTFNQIIAIIAKWRGARSTSWWLLIDRHADATPSFVSQSLLGKTRPHVRLSLGFIFKWSAQKLSGRILYSLACNNDFPSSLLKPYLHSSQPQRTAFKSSIITIAYISLSCSPSIMIFLLQSNAKIPLKYKIIHTLW